MSPRAMHVVVISLWYAIVIGLKSLAFLAELRLRIAFWSFVSRIRFRYALSRHGIPRELSSELYRIYASCIKDTFRDLRRVLGLLHT